MDEPADRLLASCYRRALELAEEYKLRSVAFAAISTGAFGYPMRPAAEVAIRAVNTQTSALRSVDHVRFVLSGSEARQTHEQVMQRVLG